VLASQFDVPSFGISALSTDLAIYSFFFWWLMLICQKLFGFLLVADANLSKADCWCLICSEIKVLLVVADSR
jgi:hypothetical protein